MEFDDIVENKRKYQEGYRRSNYHEDNRYYNDSYPTYRRIKSHDKWLFFLLKYRTSKTIRLFTRIAAIALIMLVFLIIVVLFPLIMELAHYISQNGLQGVADGIMVFLDKLWKGFAR